MNGTSDLEDISVIPQILTPTQVELADCMFILSEIRLMFVFQSSRDSVFDPSAFVDPFTTSVWICLILFLIVFSLALKAVFKCERILQRRNFCPSISLTSIMSFGALCQQGTSIVPQTIPGKCVHVIMYLTCLLLHHYYASEAVSSLIDIPLRSSIRNLRNLADSSMGIGMDESLPWIKNLGVSLSLNVESFILS